MDWLEFGRVALAPILPKALHSPNFSSQTPKPATPKPSLHTSFPQFTELPVELRLKIWSFAATPRLLRVKFGDFSPYAMHDQLPIETEGEDSEDEETWKRDPRSWRRTTVNSCTREHYSKPSTVPLPGVLFVCHESRDVLLPNYRRCMPDVYDGRGVKIDRVGDALHLPKLRGVVINPCVDMINLAVNVASRSGVQEVGDWAVIVARQIPDLRKIVLEMGIAMPPYKFWQKERFQYWKKWGDTEWWIPTRALMKMKALRQVVIVAKEGEKMLPVEWRSRTKAQWSAKLLMVQERWPEEWHGVPPRLTIVGSLEEA